MKTLALFDFDGTITRKDTFIDLLQFYKGSLFFYFIFLTLLPWMLAFKLHLIPNWKAKEIVLRRFFKGIKVDDFKDFCGRYSKQRLSKVIRKDAMIRIEEHLSRNDRVIVVSASAENWIAGWCIEHGVELIATRLKVENGRITGEIDGINCHGKEKVRRIKEVIDLSSFEKIYAYGDSKGDQEMLNASTNPHYRYFK